MVRRALRRTGLKFRRGLRLGRLRKIRDGDIAMVMFMLL